MFGNEAQLIKFHFDAKSDNVLLEYSMSGNSAQSNAVSCWCNIRSYLVRI